MEPARSADFTSALPPQPISLDVLRKKSLKDGKADAEALFDRVARALTSVEASTQRDTWAVRTCAAPPPPPVARAATSTFSTCRAPR